MMGKNVKINMLFHWSPSKNRKSILSKGLKTKSLPTINSKKTDAISCSVCPVNAWEHSGAVFPHISEEWDLYGVKVSEQDDIKILEFWGSAGIGEVLIRNSVLPENLIYIATKTINPLI